MTSPSLADVAAGFLIKVTEDANADIGAISKSLFDAANEVAVQAGAPDFVTLAKRLSIVEVGTLSVISREACDRAVAQQEWDSVGPYACVHLMALNLVDGLKEAEAAKMTAELAAWLYSQEYACRQIIAGKTSEGNNAQN
jgi:hypothetical protein